MRLTGCQMAVADGCEEDNLWHAESLLIDAGLSPGDIAVLPELLNTGYDWEAIRAITPTDSKRTLERLAELAASLSIFLVAGSIAEAWGDERFNACYVFSPDGAILARYVKTHLFSLFDEDRHFTAGDTAVSVDLSGVRTGLSICYDLRFPELYRRHVLDGVTLAVVPSVWPANRVSVMRALSIARAMENQMYVATINRGGNDSSGNSFGGSLIVDPWGTVLASADGSDETLISAEVDLSEVAKAREHIPSLSARRPEVYRLDWDLAGEFHER